MGEIMKHLLRYVDTRVWDVIEKILSSSSMSVTVWLCNTIYFKRACTVYVWLTVPTCCCCRIHEVTVNWLTFRNVYSFPSTLHHNNPWCGKRQINLNNCKLSFVSLSATKIFMTYILQVYRCTLWLWIRLIKPWTWTTFFHGYFASHFSFMKMKKPRHLAG